MRKTAAILLAAASLPDEPIAENGTPPKDL